MGCETCQYEDRIKALEEDSRKNQQTHKDFYKRFEELNVTLVMNGKDIQGVMSKLDEISRDVKEIKEKPGKRYETVAVCVITTIVGGIIGFLLNGFLPM